MRTNGKKIVLLRRFVAVLLVTFFLGGCAFFEKFFGKEEEEKPPAQLMSEGLEALEKGYYESAKEAFQKVKDRYPYSPFAVTAELKMADSLYKSERFDEAFEAYSEFERLHPKNPDIPYVIFQRGMCHFSKMKSIDRDQSSTVKAREEFERLVKKFPRNEYADSARLKLRKCYIYLAEYELYVGHFYFRNKNYRAAMGRYRYILENYPDLGQYHEALEYLAKCQEKIAEEKKEEGS